MLKTISITPFALKDLQKGIDYYNEQLKGLGVRFENKINTTFIKIQKMPQAASFAYDTVRYKVVEDFPFVIIYEEVETCIAILRIFNTHQNADRILERE